MTGCTGGGASVTVPSLPLADAFSRTNWRETAPAVDVPPTAVIHGAEVELCTKYLFLQDLQFESVQIECRVFFFRRHGIESTARSFQAPRSMWQFALHVDAIAMFSA